MNVTFSVPSAIATELNTIAQANGFLNTKAMTIAYWTATLLAAREKAIRDAVPPPNTDDVVIS